MTNQPSGPSRCFVFQRRTRVTASPEALFAFHEDPRNLSIVMPPTSRVVRLECAAHAVAGGIIILEMREMMVFPLRWICRWRTVEPARLLVDEMVEGPFLEFVHEHHFEDAGDGASVMTDVVRYAFGRGWWGRVLSATAVRLYLTLLFVWRHHQTRRHFSRHEKTL